MGTHVRIGPAAPRRRLHGRRSALLCGEAPLARPAWLDYGVPKRHFEVRDPVHTFIALDAIEPEGRWTRTPFSASATSRQQLALSSLVYPGATHRRFEHSLGVMHVASRIYDVVTRLDKTNEEIREVVPEPGSLDDAVSRSLLRLAALCHDTGHLPFSHAAEERSCFPTAGITSGNRVRDPLLRRDARRMGTDDEWPDPEQLVKIALGPRKSREAWARAVVLAVGGDLGGDGRRRSFGADRIDYLLRDSLHTGVAYGASITTALSRPSAFCRQRRGARSSARQGAT